MKTTNYYNTFIEIAEDSPNQKSVVPPVKSNMTVANLQYEILSENPYKYTSDDILFKVHVIRTEIPKEQWEKERKKFFSKGQACFRSSPLTKRYGWGIHSNKQGKIALYGAETEAYKKFLKDETITKKKAMRTKQKKTNNLAKL
jgi:hypothetical protein